MEHQPFENWILSGDPLTPSQLTELDNHLSICPHCKSIQEGLSGVEDLIRSSTFESPSPGFSRRFAVLAAQREEEARRLQSYFFLGWTLVITVIVSIGYLGTLFLTQSPNEVISGLMSSTIQAAFQLDNMLQMVKTWMHYIPLPITLAIVAGSASLVVLLTSGWIISVWKVSTQGVKTNE
ncbi:hypothetical protein [Leptolinea tardivitalis]|uniref:Zinc-finger domain-containing protein n=1 Tax=Leptolinea tardivitalis TaxID=229920 RepID=A0A0P6WP77_9CHLR|nr:hypothetical protein [Leptolinea tardivitalis]KPL71853.1 hypothetical protein ADM99_10570 [Leptolinea tardivitalis]GAP20247.1 hypothetical protein LTAR_00435 [Leptolinea tardivitalis]